MALLRNLWLEQLRQNIWNAVCIVWNEFGRHAPSTAKALRAFVANFNFQAVKQFRKFSSVPLVGERANPQRTSGNGNSSGTRNQNRLKEKILSKQISQIAAAEQVEAL